MTLAAFVNALGIPNVGKKLASDLAEYYGSMDALRHADAEELAKIDDIGDIVADDIVRYFDRNSKTVDELLARGSRPSRPFADRAESCREGMWCLRVRWPPCRAPKPRSL